MLKNKKIILTTIVCGLALTFIPSATFATEFYCRCDGKDKEIFNDWDKCIGGGCWSVCPTGTKTAECVEYAASTPSGGQTSAAPSPASAKLINPLKTTSLPALIGRVISAILGIVGSLALVMFIWGGLLWMTAHGNPNQLTKGKDTLVWATIGLVVIFLSYTLVNFVIKGLTGTLPAGGGGGSVIEPAIEVLPQELTGICTCKGETITIKANSLSECSQLFGAGCTFNNGTCACPGNPIVNKNYTEQQCNDLSKLMGGCTFSP